MKQKMSLILERETRQKLTNLIEKLRIDRSIGREICGQGDNRLIECHLENIRRVSGGAWSEHVAIEYLRNLEAQVAGKSGPFLYKPSM